MRALLIKVDFSTGRRAGGINPRDPKLPCHGWQDLDNGLEIRLVEDDRDLSKYADVPGVTVLQGKETINQAIVDNIPAQYGIKSEAILIAHLKERGVSLDIFASKKETDIVKQLFSQGFAGITKRTPKLLE